MQVTQYLGIFLLFSGLFFIIGSRNKPKFSHWNFKYFGLQLTDDLMKVVFYMFGGTMVVVGILLIIGLMPTG